MFRGGTWTYVPAMSRATMRLPGDEQGGYRDTIIGFRCAAVIPELEIYISLTTALEAISP